jgi:3-oxoacyl-[acyl-carrier-protein] synthase-3
LRIVEGLEKSLKLPNATTIKKVHKYGNTSAASIPTALVDALEAGEIKGGETAVFTAVGAGLSWGACALRLGERTTPINTSDAKLPDFDGKAVDTIRKAIEYQIPEKLDLI